MVLSQWCLHRSPATRSEPRIANHCQDMSLSCPEDVASPRTQDVSSPRTQDVASPRTQDLVPVDDSEPSALARRIEAGLYAEHLLAGRGHSTASDDELRVIACEGRDAMRRCVVAHLRFVGTLAREMSRRTGQCQYELFQEGCLGLLEAVKRFDYGRGVPFAGFAAHWIRYYQGHLGDRSAFGGAARARARRRLLRVVDGLCQQLGRPVTESDLAAVGERRSGEVLAEVRVVSLHRVDGGDLEVADPRWEEGRSTPLEDLHTVRALLTVLSDLERRVIELRFGLGETPTMTGVRAAAELGLSVSVVRRIEHGALSRLRAAGRELVAA